MKIKLKESQIKNLIGKSIKKVLGEERDLWNDLVKIKQNTDGDISNQATILLKQLNN